MSRKQWIVVAVLLVAAASFRISIAHWLANDAPDDGRVYAQMARNVLEQHVYSHATEAPYEPSLIRLPGYPLFLAAIYSVFGHGNNGAVRMIQALIDTGTCALIALLAFYWQPDPKKKRTTGIAALAFATFCPFAAIYVATILTETITMFLLVAMFLVATLALRSSTTDGTEEAETKKLKSALLWAVTGVVGAIAVYMRPDAGLFVAAVGLTLVIGMLWPLVIGLRKESKARVERPTVKPVIIRMMASGATLSIAFVLVLAPWTIRNWRVFHVFQPIAPSHAEMPGEFVSRGYFLWLRTWLDDEEYVQPFLWAMDTDPIDIDDVPPSAYDSPEEKARIAALLDKYNHADDESDSEDAPASTADNSKATASPTASPTPAASPSKNPTQTSNANANANTDQGDDSSGDEEDNQPSENDANAQNASVEMTPEIDAGFAQLARERISRHPFRFYVWLPLKRAHAMWFNTHSQYWPFEGSLLPIEDLDYQTHQQIWLPLFAGLTAIWTIAGLGGLWLLSGSKDFYARLAAILTALVILTRLILIARMENPEPRYLVEFFPLLSVLAGIAITQVLWALKREEK
jgi:hypothetical protein